MFWVQMAKMMDGPWNKRRPSFVNHPCVKWHFLLNSSVTGWCTTQRRFRSWPAFVKQLHRQNFCRVLVFREKKRQRSCFSESRENRLGGSSSRKSLLSFLPACFDLILIRACQQRTHSAVSQSRRWVSWPQLWGVKLQEVLVFDNFMFHFLHGTFSACFRPTDVFLISNRKKFKKWISPLSGVELTLPQCHALKSWCFVWFWSC